MEAREAPGSAERAEEDLDTLLKLVARGDQGAFEALYERLARPAYGLVRKVLRDPAQSEEVVQEVLLEVWRTAARFDPARGGAATWVLTIAHRRAVDRVRSETAAAERERRAQRDAYYGGYTYPEVAKLLEVALGTIKTRIRDGLNRLRDCLGVS